MSRRNLWAVLLIGPLVVLPAACGDRGADRASLEEEELERELELALAGDTATPTLEDKPVEQPQSQPPASQPPAQRPRSEPRPEQPRREEPRAEQPQPRPRTVTLSVPTGTTFAVRMNETLSTETNVAGDGFSATLTDPIVGPDGTVLIPAGATVRGRVTAAEKSNRVGETAVIKVAFESVSFGGRSYPMQASVVEAEVERRTRTTKKESAAKVAAGAAAGAILGQVLGKDTESTLKGAAAGAAAGTAIAMGTADVDAVLPAGARMVIRLDSPVEVRR